MLILKRREASDLFVGRNPQPGRTIRSAATFGTARGGVGAAVLVFAASLFFAPNAVAQSSDNRMPSPNPALLETKTPATNAIPPAASTPPSVNSPSTVIVSPPPSQMSSVSTQTQSATVTRNSQGSTSNTTTTTTTTETSPELRGTQPAPAATTTPPAVTKRKKHLKNDWHTARRLAKYHWLDKVAESDPQIIQTICAHKTAAEILAKHPRIGWIAQQDHYLCRRLTRWKSVAILLAKNGDCERVIALDPEGTYRAIRRDRRFAKLLSTNPMYDQMINDNPDLARVMADYI